VGRASFPEIYYVKYVDNSSLVREVDPEKRRECFRLLGVGILVFLSVLLILRQHLQCVRIGYEIEQLKVQRVALEEWQHQLQLQQAALSDPQRIDTLARKDLGMVPPDPRQVIQAVSADAVLPEQPESVQLARNSSATGGGDPSVP
jgi:cell division protein FtsL